MRTRDATTRAHRAQWRRGVDRGGGAGRHGGPRPPHGLAARGVPHSARVPRGHRAGPDPPRRAPGRRQLWCVPPPAVDARARGGARCAGGRLPAAGSVVRARQTTRPAVAARHAAHTHTRARPVLCCAVLRCAVPCCAVLCCAVLCCAVLCCAVLCCAVLCCAACRPRVPGPLARAGCGGQGAAWAVLAEAAGPAVHDRALGDTHTATHTRVRPCSRAQGSPTAAGTRRLGATAAAAAPAADARAAAAAAAAAALHAVARSCTTTSTPRLLWQTKWTW
jgi:hypothetical protein